MTRHMFSVPCKLYRWMRIKSHIIQVLDGQALRTHSSLATIKTVDQGPHDTARLICLSLCLHLWNSLFLNLKSAIFQLEFWSLDVIFNLWARNKQHHLFYTWQWELRFLGVINNFHFSNKVKYFFSIVLKLIHLLSVEKYFI